MWAYKVVSALDLPYLFEKASCHCCALLLFHSRSCLYGFRWVLFNIFYFIYGFFRAWAFFFFFRCFTSFRTQHFISHTFHFSHFFCFFAFFRFLYLFVSHYYGAHHSAFLPLLLIFLSALDSVFFPAKRELKFNMFAFLLNRI